MIGFIFIGIPIICIVALIVMGCSGAGNSKGINTNVASVERNMQGQKPK